MAWLAPSAKEVRRLKKTSKMKRSINICWIGSDGKTHKRSTGTKDYLEAKAKLEEFKAQLKEQQTDGLYRTLFSEAANELIQKRTRDTNLKERTQTRYRTLSEGFIAFAGDILVSDITVDLVDGFKDWSRQQIIITNRAGEVRTKKRMSDKTLEMGLQFIKSVLDYSQEKGYTTNNISSKIATIPKSKIQQKAIRAFTDDELMRIMTAPELHPNIRMCFMGLLYLGVRSGELAKITWDKVDLKGRSIRVFGEKTNKWRTIPISSSLLFHLEKAYAERGDRNNVFQRESGGKVDQHIYNSLMRICKTVGIDTVDLTVHSFRHTFIQRHLQAGVNFKTIMQWSGHQDVKTFMIYLEQYQPKPEDINIADYCFLEDAIRNTV